MDKILRLLLALLLSTSVLSSTVPSSYAKILFDGAPPSATSAVTNADTFILDSENSATDVTLQFGSTLNETLRWNNTTSQFDLSDDLNLSGGLTSTALTSTGVVNFSGGTSFRVREVADEAAATCTTVKELVVDTTENRIYICTVVGAPGTWTNVAGAGGSQDFEGVYSTDTGDDLVTSGGNFTITAGAGDFIVDSNDWNVTSSGALDAATVTSNGTFTSTGTANLNGAANFNGTTTIGDNGDTVAVNSSDWDISTTGAMTGIGAITMDGLLTGTAGATISGATTSINNSSNFATNVGTGTTTGQVSLGGNSNCVQVDSNTWDVSCAGVFSGLTGLSSSGTVNFSTSTSFRMSEQSSDPATCTEGEHYYNTTTHTDRICVATNTWTSSGAAGTQFVFAYDTTTQTVASAGTFQDLTFNTNGQLDGWTHTAGSANFTSTVGGTYMANITGRVAKNGGANSTLSFVGVLNGAQIAGSQGYGTISGSSGDTMSVNFIFTTAASDVFKIQMTAGTSNGQILPGGNGTVQPSAQISVWRLK